jgi:hypothetical protein
MHPSAKQDSCLNRHAVGGIPAPVLTQIKPPQSFQILKSSRAPETIAPEKHTEAKPSHLARENPPNRELAKERWYTRAAWASIALGYSATLFAIKYGEAPAATLSMARGLCVDTLFCYWALKNSELRRFILEGYALPKPTHADLTVRCLLAAGALCYLTSSVANAYYTAFLVLGGDFVGAAVRAASMLVTLHLGAAWLRRARFFGRLHSQ